MTTRNIILRTLRSAKGHGMTEAFDPVLLGLGASYYEDGDAVLPVVADRLEETGDRRLPAFRDAIALAGPQRDAVLASIVPELPAGCRRRHEAGKRAAFLARTTPAVGRYVEPDGWSYGASLQPSDWDAAAFRLPSNLCASMQWAVNVTVTGTCIRRRHGSECVRVRIEFVGDGEVSTFHGGWLLL